MRSAFHLAVSFAVTLLPVACSGPPVSSTAPTSGPTRATTSEGSTWCVEDRAPIAPSEEATFAALRADLLRFAVNEAVKSFLDDEELARHSHELNRDIVDQFERYVASVSVLAREPTSDGRLHVKL